VDAPSAAVPATTPRAIHPWVAEQARRVRFGVYNGPLADWPALRVWAQDVERLGFDSLWIGDHTTFYPVDCWTTLAAVAVHTERLRLGPLVSCVYYRPPALLARMAADVDRLSGGRLVLGLGIGDIPKEFQQLGLAEPPFPERAAALTETSRRSSTWPTRSSPARRRS
jgi:alkanesulfonate monooxygenase SsuD/methylene tetrahydromethanopterin reductase-like flavin-dependent oxidoreductase (luciferase family)